MEQKSDKNRYVSIQQIGRSMSDVYKALDNETNESVAIIKRELEWDGKIDCAPYESLNCPYIVNHKDSFIDKQTDEQWIITEYCDASISELTKVSNSKLNEWQIQIIIKECLLALKYLYSTKYWSTQPFEIKASVIMVNKKAFEEREMRELIVPAYIRRAQPQKYQYFPSELTSLIVAFYPCEGIIKLRLKPTLEQNRKARNRLESPCWTAPEFIMNYDKIKDYTKCGIWSLGITAIEMATGKAPYQDKHKVWALMRIAHDYKNNISPKLPQNEEPEWSDSFRDFVDVCLVNNEEKRASVDELLNHEWIKNAKEEDALKDWIVESIEKLECALREEEDDDDDDLGY